MHIAQFVYSSAQMPTQASREQPESISQCSCFGKGPRAAQAQDSGETVVKSEAAAKAMTPTKKETKRDSSIDSPSRNVSVKSVETNSAEAAPQGPSRNQVIIPQGEEEKILDQISRIRLRGMDQSIIRAQELWQHGPAMLLLIRRPGCSKPECLLPYLCLSL